MTTSTAIDAASIGTRMFPATSVYSETTGTGAGAAARMEADSCAAAEGQPTSTALTAATASTGTVTAPPRAPLPGGAISGTGASVVVEAGAGAGAGASVVVGAGAGAGAGVKEEEHPAPEASRDLEQLLELWSEQDTRDLLRYPQLRGAVQRRFGRVRCMWLLAAMSPAGTAVAEALTQARGTTGKKGGGGGAHSGGSASAPAFGADDALHIGAPGVLAWLDFAWAHGIVTSRACFLPPELGPRGKRERRGARFRKLTGHGGDVLPRPARVRVAAAHVTSALAAQA